jgi:hypothetical protein
MAENLIRSMLKGTQHENMEEITWEELNAQEKRECLGSAAVDIDFTLFSSQCLHLLAEPFVNLLLSNVSGTVVMRPYVAVGTFAVPSIGLVSCLGVADSLGSSLFILVARINGYKGSY